MNVSQAMPDVLERQNRTFHPLRIALDRRQSLDLKTILNEVLGKGARFMGVDAGVIYVIDDETLK